MDKYIGLRVLDREQADEGTVHQDGRHSDMLAIQWNKGLASFVFPTTFDHMVRLGRWELQKN